MALESQLVQTAILLANTIWQEAQIDLEDLLLRPATGLRLNRLTATAVLRLKTP